MNFIKTATTVNFVISILSLGMGELSLTIKPTTDAAKVYCKAKKMSKAVAVVIPAEELGTKIDALENGVAALVAALA